MKNTFTDADKIGVQLTNTTDDYKVKYGDITYISSEIVIAYLYNRYGDFYCTNLHTKFEVFQGLHTRDFARAFEAMAAEYDPLNNFNITETRATMENHGKTTDTRKTDANHNTVTASALAGTKSETYTTTDDSTTPRLDTRDTSEGGTATTDDLWTTNEKERANTSLTLDGFEYEAHDVHAERITNQGDTGNVTAQSMIEEERKLRLNPVQKNFLDLFIIENACYIGGAWV